MRSVPDQYAKCRGWGHTHWQFTTVTRAAGEYRQGLVCVDCGTERSVKIDLETGIRKNKYTYPEDHDAKAVPYKMPEGGPLTSDERAAIILGEIEGRYRSNGHRKPRKKRPT